MTNETETAIVLNQHGEQTDLAVPENFGQGLAFLNPSEMPDLDNAELGFNIQPESIEFKSVGESLRAVFNGFTTFNVKDKINKGAYIPKKTAVLQTKNGIKINMGANLVKQLELVPVGSAIQITYKGEVKTNSGNEVKTYEVVTLNVPRSAVPQMEVKPAPQDAKPEARPIDAFWAKVYEMGLTNIDGQAILKENGGDFGKAYGALIGNKF